MTNAREHYEQKEREGSNPIEAWLMEKGSNAIGILTKGNGSSVSGALVNGSTEPPSPTFRSCQRKQHIHWRWLAINSPKTVPQDAQLELH